MIVRRNPDDEQALQKTEQAWFESNAPDNAQAIREINAEASKYGLVRTKEYWLQQFTLDGNLVYRGFCWRMEPSGIGQKLAQARAGNLVGVSSSEIVRGMRDNEE